MGLGIGTADIDFRVGSISGCSSQVVS
jgi:hypothetical protein